MSVPNPLRLFDRNRRLFQVLLAAWTALLLALAAVSVIRFGRSPTDENLFTNAPSRLYVTRTVAAVTVEGEPDSLRAGDLVSAVDGQKLQDLRSLLDIAGNAPGPTYRVSLVRQNRRFELSLRDSGPLAGAVRELHPFAYVTLVTSGGASDRAGMKVGDIILRINGQTFRNVAEADMIMRQGQAGKAVAYEILREDRTLTLHVTLAAFGITFSVLSMVIAGLTFIGLGLFVGLMRPGIHAARLLALTYIVAGFALTVVTLTRDPSTDVLAVARRVIGFTCVFLTFPLSLHLQCYFPKERPELITRKWILRVAYGMALLALLVASFGGGLYVQGALAGLGFYLAFIAIRYGKFKTPEHRRLLRPVKYAGSAVVALVLASTLAVILFAPGRPLDLVGVLGLSLLLIPAAQLYVIGRHRLFDLDLRVRRNLQYVATTAVFRISMILLFVSSLLWLADWDMPVPNIQLTGASVEILQTPPDPREEAFLRALFVAGGAIVLLAIFWVAGRTGLALNARLFHRTGYDYRRAAAELAEVMSTNLNMNDLARGIVERLQKLMQLKRAGVVFFRNQTACCCQEVAGFDGTAWKQFCMQAEADLAHFLRDARDQVRVSYLPEHLRAELASSEFHLMVPIRSKEKVLGAILVGEKQSESGFEEEDFEFLASAAKQASVAIENAFLYEELAEQDRMKHELAIARRIQLASLPQVTPQVEGLDVAGISIPAMEVGGDYFDYLDGTPGVLTIVVGDVSGKGTSAALYMSKVQGIFRSLHTFGLTPRDLLIRANELLCGDLERKSFVTAIGGAFDTQRRVLLLSRAGHPPVFRLDGLQGTVSTILPRGIGIGLQAGSVFSGELEEADIPLTQGDVFVFLTDGVTDASRADGEQFGNDRVAETIRLAGGLPAADIRDALLESVTAFCGEIAQADDKTVVVVKVL